MHINLETIRMLSRRPLYAMAGAVIILSPFAASRVSAEENARFVVPPVENPRHCGNELFRAFENYYSPRIRNRIEFRTINLFGVAGPEHHVEIVYRP